MSQREQQGQAFSMWSELRAERELLRLCFVLELESPGDDVVFEPRIRLKSLHLG